MYVCGILSTVAEKNHPSEGLHARPICDGCKVVYIANPQETASECGFVCGYLKENATGNM